jgi:hypothetical protein
MGQLSGGPSLRPVFFTREYVSRGTCSSRVVVVTHERMELVSGVSCGHVSGNPVVHYVGIDPGNHLPLMIALDSRGRHWLTDGTRSTVVYPPMRENSGVGAVSFTYDYSVDGATSLLSTVDPIKTKELPYDSLIHVNWLILAVHRMVQTHPRGTLGIDRAVLDHDPLFASSQLRVKIQGAEKLYLIKRLRPRRRGHFLIEIIARDNEQVMLLAEHTVLGLVLNKTLEVHIGDAEQQAREIMAEVLEFIWECNTDQRNITTNNMGKSNLT